MIKAVLFDLGGVLLTDIFIEFDVYLAEKAGVDELEFKAFRHQKWQEYELGNISGIEFMTLLKNEFNIPMTAEEMLARSYDFIKLNKDSISIVKALRKKGLKVGVVTNNSDEWQRYERDKLGLGKYFDCWISSSDLHKKKPGKEIYECASKELSVSNEDCVFIDNRGINVEGVVRCGMRGILFESADQLRKELRKLGIEV